MVLGGDDSIPIPVLRAYRDVGPLCVVQIDAHIDFRDEVNGVTEGLSSTMRRASEMPWVSGIAQVGLRGIGSAREREFADARAFGAVHITAAEIHRDGIAPALARIPDADRYFITLDIDGLDPAIAPGVIAPAFGGLSYFQAFDLIRGVAARGRIVGFDVVEVVPELDVRNLTSLLAARLVMVMIGSIAWSGQLTG
ncbi:MAG: Agmatinase [uncultured Thermomicrobiales bacterium]|uniref:Agmatinase n=1 Tax=uncultured Thermomicrobiales bacterium TaxID=1645740 RepID=A0A6J4VFP5_9BACT|nr:MAG: Agmatinase [uncultured Thermomicrobiales bacterium]